MKAFLIDPEARTVAEIDIDPSLFLKTAYAAIDCQLVECVSTAIPGHDLWVDEEGSLYDEPPHGLLYIPGTPSPLLFGRAIVTGGPDDEGDTMPATCSARDIMRRVFAVADFLPGGIAVCAPLTIAQADNANA